MGQKKSLQRGFTIVEILIVVIVVGILAAITIVSFNASQKQAQATRTIAMVKSSSEAIDAYYTKNGQYPGEISYDPVCLGDGYANSTCGTNDISGDCSAFGYPSGSHTLESITTSAKFQQDLQPFLRTSLPTIEYPPTATRQRISETCNLAMTSTGPTYATVCDWYFLNGDFPRLATVKEGCGARAYSIDYYLPQKNADCTIPGSYNVSKHYSNQGSEPDGSICTLIKGKRAQ